MSARRCRRGGTKLRLTSQPGRCLWERLSPSLERRRASWELRQYARPAASRGDGSTALGRLVSGTLQNPALQTGARIPLEVSPASECRLWGGWSSSGPHGYCRCAPCGECPALR